MVHEGQIYKAVVSDERALGVEDSCKQIPHWLWDLWVLPTNVKIVAIVKIVTIIAPTNSRYYGHLQ